MHDKILAEYIWLDGSIPVRKLRSKARVVATSGGPIGIEDLPVWSYDGSSTYQATGHDSDLTLKPVRVVPDPIRGGGNLLVLCEVFNPDGKPHETNTRAHLREVLDAAWRYAGTTGRRVSIEYALIKDINDQAWRADLLGKLVKGHLVHVNLIPLNPTPGSKWTASRPEDEREFVRRLQSHGVSVTVRDTRGQEIDGACGQLAAAEK